MVETDAHTNAQTHLSLLIGCDQGWPQQKHLRRRWGAQWCTQLSAAELNGERETQECILQKLKNSVLYREQENVSSIKQNHWRTIT